MAFLKHEASRRGLLKAGITAAAAFGPGCIPYLLRVEEPMRNGNERSLSDNALGFKKGETTFDRAIEIMEVNNLSGVAAANYQDAYGNRLAFLAADYQRYAYAFKREKYDKAIDLDCNTMLPYGIILNAARYDGDMVLLAFYRDKNERDEPKAVSYGYRKGEYIQFASIGMGEVAMTNNGISSPFFLGSDLRDGIIFMARDGKGTPPGSAWLFKMRDGTLDVEKITSYEAAKKCQDMGRGDDVATYLYGGPAPGLAPSEPLPKVRGIDY